MLELNLYLFDIESLAIINKWAFPLYLMINYMLLNLSVNGNRRSNFVIDMPISH